MNKFLATFFLIPLLFPILVKAQPPGFENRDYGPSPNSLPYFRGYQPPKETDMLFDLEKITTFETLIQQAFAFGVYSSDLCYISKIGNPSKGTAYIDAMTNLTFKMGLRNIFRQTIVEEYIKDRASKDALQYAYSQSVSTCNEALILSKKYEESAMMISGAWLEALYINLKLYESTNDKLYANRAVEQKFALEQIIKCLNQFNDKTIEKMNKDMIGLQAIYDEATLEVKNATNITDAESGQTTVGGKNVIKLPTKSIEELAGKVAIIRSKWLAKE